MIFFIVLILTLWLILIRVRAGTWASPAVFFSACWVVYLTVPAVVGFGLPIDFFALIYILAAVVAFSLPVFLGRSYVLRPSSRPALHSVFALKFAFRINFALTVALVVFILSDMLYQGYALSAVLSNPVAVSADYSAKAYSGEMAQSVYRIMSIVILYPAAAYGGLVYASSLRSRWLVLTITFLPSLLIMLLQSMKGMFLLCLALFVGSVFACRVHRREPIKFGGRVLARAAFYALFGAVLLSLSFVGRGLITLESLPQALERLFYVFGSYAGGHLFAFSDWFVDRYFGAASMSYMQEYWTGGFYTFMGIFRLAGDTRFVPLGTYVEYFSYYPRMETNIYTIFRGLITDFGWLGGLFIMFIMGAIMQMVFEVFLRLRVPVLSLALYVFFFAFSYQSYLVSSLMFPSFLFSFFLFIALLFVTLAFRKGARF